VNILLSLAEFPARDFFSAAVEHPESALWILELDSLRVSQSIPVDTTEILEWVRLVVLRVWECADAPPPATCPIPEPGSKRQGQRMNGAQLGGDRMNSFFSNRSYSWS
jgi:hypothetical protein